jgi:hypothetical protein
MKKQYTIPLVLFLLGMVITIIGALFKIMHWPGANFFLSLGLFSEAAAIIVIMIAITKRWK